MYKYLQLDIFKTGLILLLLSVCLIESSACDKNIIGAIGPPNNIINSGEVGCVTGDFSGSVTVNSGGILRICGQYTFSGSINVAAGAKVVITAGSSIGVIGSITFNDIESLEYSGDPACNAEIYAITVNSCFVTWGAVPGLSGRFCNFNNIYLAGFNFAWGPSTRGLARSGRAPFLCSGGGSAPCATLLMDALTVEASRVQENVLLEWSIPNVKNIDFFTVEKSQAGLNWETVATLSINSDNVNQNSFLFTDRQAFREGSYYRIRQTTIDGQSSLSAVKYISALSQEHTFSIYPNPSNGKFRLSLAANHNFEQYKVIDALGRTICNGIVDTKAVQEINLSKITKGVYTIVISSDEAVLTKSIIIE